MSRIGKRPIALPKEVKVTYEAPLINIKGPKGESSYSVPDEVALVVGQDEIQFNADYQNDKKASTMLGTARAIINNMVLGVTAGFERKLQLVGVGYRAQVQGTAMELSLGYSKPIQYQLPQGVTAVVANNNQITLSSHDKATVGQAAAQIRALRPPEPYQGKGVSYEGERIRRKAGKTGKR